MEIKSLQYIVSHPEQVVTATVRGVRWIQLRVKDEPYAEWKKLALETQAECKKHGDTTFIINDNPALALEIGADGVHLGQQDMPPAKARALLGPGFIIGGTANTFSDIERLAAEGVDYIGLGPFRFTKTKKNLAPVLGLAGYQQVLAQCRAADITVPIVGVGGILLADVPALLATGLHGIAVAGAIEHAEDIRGTIYGFVKSVLAVSSFSLWKANRW